MTRIGVVSDTHMSGLDQARMKQIHDTLGHVDMIVHAGDITSLEVVNALAAPQVLAVAGNMDGPMVAAALPVKREFKVEGFRFGLIHGWGAKTGLENRIINEFEDVDCIIYGHTHRPANFKSGGVMFFNPGSAGGAEGTVGVLEVGQGLEGRILPLKA